MVNVHQPRRPRLSKSGLITVTSPSGHGLAGLARTCPHPGCQCRDVFIEAVPIDFRVESVSVKKGKMLVDALKVGGLGPAIDSESAIVARLITDTGELLVEKDRTSNPDADALLAPLRDVLDGELLDDFAKLWFRLKGQTTSFDEPRPDVDLRDWEPSDLLGYEEVFDVPRVDAYRVGDNIYELSDLYCPDPGCDCNVVDLVFMNAAVDGDDAGAVTIDLTSGDVAFRHFTDDEGIVPGLWRSFVDRHRGVSILIDRQAKMSSYGKGLMEKVREASEKQQAFRRPPASPTDTGRRGGRKIGRNEPCPCGSGKKYKKCCLNRSPGPIIAT